MKLYLILDNIRSMENVGSIFRTADAAGVDRIFLCGLTPRPPRKEIDKTALGAVDFVEWEYKENVKTLISNFKKEGTRVIALEQNPRSINYLEANSLISPNTPIALVVGNEVSGVDPEILNLCDTILEIPMRGQKNSLNVAVSTGIALYKITE
jgi:tRNA G18 (ribose-2'-O)-methylase SpoU